VDPIVFAIPLFFALMGVEASLARRRGRRAYHAGTAVSSIAIGAISQLSGLLLGLVGLGLYTLCYARLRLFTLPAEAWGVWLGAVVGCDFLYY